MGRKKKMNRLQSGSSCVYEVFYHIVWCPKYRKPVLEKQILSYLKTAIPIICESKEWVLHEMNVQPDHVHLFISAHPKYAPTDIVKVVKGVTGLRLFKEFPSLKREYWGGHIWSPSYYVGTVGSVTKSAIANYIVLNSSTEQSSGGILEGKS